jgi:hypothetical protein
VSTHFDSLAPERYGNRSRFRPRRGFPTHLILRVISLQRRIRAARVIGGMAATRGWAFSVWLLWTICKHAASSGTSRSGT